MRIIRFVAADTRQAMRGVARQLGENAVILSSKRTDEGVEVTAGADVEPPRGQAADSSAGDCGAGRSRPLRRASMRRRPDRVHGAP